MINNLLLLTSNYNMWGCFLPRVACASRWFDAALMKACLRRALPVDSSAAPVPLQYMCWACVLHAFPANADEAGCVPVCPSHPAQDTACNA